MSAKIIITVQGGIVQSVLSSDPEAEAFILDLDFSEFSPEEEQDRQETIKSIGHWRRKEGIDHELL